MGEETMCESSEPKKPESRPKTTIVLGYNEEIVLIKGNNKFTLRIDNDGHLIGTQEKEIRL